VQKFVTKGGGGRKNVNIAKGKDDPTFRTRTMSELGRLQQKVAGLLIYRDILDDPIVRSMVSAIESMSYRKDLAACMRGYGDVFYALAQTGKSWEDYAIEKILLAENPFTQQAQRVTIDRLPKQLILAAQHDLESLEYLYQFGLNLPRTFKEICGIREDLVAWLPSQTIHPDRAAIIDRWKSGGWVDRMEDLCSHYHRYGAGIWAKYQMFRWQSKLVGIEHSDRVPLDSLVGYEEQKAMMIGNTKALIDGHRALNILLYGSKGTGKSSLVKALIDRYRDRHLKLIEVNKSTLYDLPLILELITDLPQKFIIFVDDLSFEDDDENFKALKVLLEGSATAKPSNVVVYATSNRRHLVREYFTERPRPMDADEIHNWDTVQEKLSFSDRFGITLTFQPADQDKYLDIVTHLARRAKLEIEPTELNDRALQWATRHHGRSGRTARQFIDFLSAGNWLV
jgi:uncharacterized protein